MSNHDDEMSDSPVEKSADFEFFSNEYSQALQAEAQPPLGHAALQQSGPGGVRAGAGAAGEYPVKCAAQHFGGELFAPVGQLRPKADQPLGAGRVGQAPQAAGAG